MDLKIAARFREHRDAQVITSMPGMGPLLGAEFIAWTGGDMDAFGSAGRLAGVAGLAPVPRDSGRISGNMRRPHRYHRRLLRVVYLSAQIAARFCPTSKTFYDRKRSEGKSHKQAILALARRRLTFYGHSYVIGEPLRFSLLSGSHRGLSLRHVSGREERLVGVSLWGEDQNEVSRQPSGRLPQAGQDLCLARTAEAEGCGGAVSPSPEVEQERRRKAREAREVEAHAAAAETAGTPEMSGGAAVTLAAPPATPVTQVAQRPQPFTPDLLPSTEAVDASGELSADELDELDELDRCERAFANADQAQWMRGVALHAVRDRRLYRHGGCTWPQYCEEIGLSESDANRMIQEYPLARAIAQIWVSPKMVPASHVRALLELVPVFDLEPTAGAT